MSCFPPPQKNLHTKDVGANRKKTPITSSELTGWSKIDSVI